MGERNAKDEGDAKKAGGAWDPAKTRVQITRDFARGCGRRRAAEVELGREMCCDTLRVCVPSQSRSHV